MITKDVYVRNLDKNWVNFFDPQIVKNLPNGEFVICKKTFDLIRYWPTPISLPFDDEAHFLKFQLQYL